MRNRIRRLQLAGARHRRLAEPARRQRSPTVYELLKSWGLPTSPYYKVVRRPRRPPSSSSYYGAHRAAPAGRARDRRHRHQGRRARPARRARRDQPRAALGDRLQVPARAGEHQAARHRRLDRSHRARDAVRRHGEGARRRVSEVRQATLHNQDVVKAQGRADRRHGRAAQGRRRDPRGARPGRRAARRHRARVRHADRTAPSAARRSRRPRRATSTCAARTRGPARRRCAAASSTSRSRGALDIEAIGEVGAAALTQPLHPSRRRSSPRPGCSSSPSRPVPDRGASCATYETGLVKVVGENGLPAIAARRFARKMPPSKPAPEGRAGRPIRSPASARGATPTTAQVDELEKAKQKELWRFLVALSIRHVGPVAARALAALLRIARRDPRGAPGPSSPRSTGSAASSRMPCSTGSRSTGTSRSSSSGGRPGCRGRSRITRGPVNAAAADGPLAGLTVVATGSLEGFTREGALEAIIARGRQGGIQRVEEDRLRGGRSGRRIEARQGRRARAAHHRRRAVRDPGPRGAGRAGNLSIVGSDRLR